MAIYLGLDASTQSLTAMLIEVDAAVRRVLFEHSFQYDEALPQYGTTRGVRHGPEPNVVVAPPLMWMEALDLMIGRLVRERPREMARLSAVSGSAQQHGSVYLTAKGVARLPMLDASAPLAMQMRHAFSRPVAPVWMDSSTTVECAEIAAAVGGDAELVRHTGSRAFERFTGPQIRRFFKGEPKAYAATSRIHLVSSFLASALCGGDAPVDPGDGAGTNLMDLAAGAWWNAAVRATAAGLGARLPRISPSATVVGTLSAYWRERYGLPDARVVAWSGDNPSSLIGTGLVDEGRVGISLGTSDTIFGVMREPRVDPSWAGSVFGAPTGAFMGITVFLNGSLARERVRDTFGMTWEAFSAALRSTPPGNAGAMLLPWFDPEITPHVPAAAVHRFGLAEADGPAHVRAVVEAQMMAMANHSRWMGVDVSAIHATGGASQNPEILQVMADVFGADVYRLPSGNSACLGAALRAWHADRLAAGDPLTWPQIVSDLATPSDASRIRPVADRVPLYAELRRRYAGREADALSGRRAEGR